MLQPRSRLTGAAAIRFDVPARINRHGAGAGLLHALERRAFGLVRLLLPIGLHPREEEYRPIAADAPAIALPIPVDPNGSEGRPREPLAIAYAGNPEKKGLDLVAEAWRTAAPPGWRLVVTGIDPSAARRFLRRRGIEEPERIEWAGVIERSRYLELLAGATIFLAASRYEDYGIAQLEALAAGALLVTVPSAGPYEALGVARGLDPPLVAAELSAPALADVIARAAALDSERRSAYGASARELIRPYSREALATRLRDEVLPVLLN
jgi:glycosyltransferase involved in cell wall biosynthesis